MDYNLKKGEVISLKAASSSFLRVADGCIWLTLPDDPRDYLLGRGDRFNIGTDGLLVLEALTDATFGMASMTESLLRTTIQVNPYAPHDALLLAGHPTKGC